MVRKIFKAFGGESQNIHEAAYLLGFFALFAQILALFRDRLLAHYFGASATLDIYYAAFRIPDLIFTIVASLVAGSVLIPFIQEKIDKGHDEVKKLVDEVWSAFAIIMVVSAIVTFFFMPFLVSKLFSAMDMNAQASVVDLSRILLLSPIFLGFSNFLSSIIQSHKRFALYALSPVLYNLGIMVGIIFFLPTFGISGVVFGVVIGSILHAVIQIPFAKSISLFPDLVFPLRFAKLKSIAFLSLFRTLSLVLMNLVIIVLVSLAAKMTAGSISIFNFAYNLQTGPLSIIGVSYSMAAFPTLSKLFVGGHKDKFVEQVSVTFRHIIFWSLPATALLIIVRAQIVRTILGSGAFTWGDTRLTAACVAIFAISIVAQSANLLFIRAYYAAGKTKIPLVISLISTVFTIFITYVFYELFVNYPYIKDFVSVVFKVGDISGTEVLALPLGFTIGNIANLAMFIYVFNRDFKKLFSKIKDCVLDSLSASFVGGLAAYTMLAMVGMNTELKTLAAVFGQGLSAGVTGIVFWFITLKLLKSKEADELLGNIKGKIWKAKVVVPERTEI
jgi:putative peptidoglycan lipid II flippase